MKGLELCRQFYEACRPTLWADIPDIMQHAAVGLVGEGSDCFGCDDAASRDHDFGPAFCLWLPREVLNETSGEIRTRIDAALTRLPLHFGGFESRLTPERRRGRVGPLAVEDFYQFFTGIAQTPHSALAWLAIPEYQLAACTNGAVFEDNAGLFTARREALLPCYPTDVRLKKMAARCMVMAQAGQYNLPRSLERGDPLAAMLAMARFAEAALSLIFLCNKRYMPFYKWAGKQAAALPILGADVTRLLAELARPLAANSLQAHNVAVMNTIEALCAAVATHLRETGLSKEPDNWLWAHGPQIMRQVQDTDLRNMDMLQG